MNFNNFLEKLKIYTQYFDEETLNLYNKLLNSEIKINDGEKPLTENGQKILKAMQENEEKYFNVFSSKQIAEFLFIAPRSVSGSIRTLITKGYVEKIETSPVTYKLTELGKDYRIDNV